MNTCKWICSALLMTLCFGVHSSEDVDFIEKIPREVVNPWQNDAYFGPIDVYLECDYGIIARIETQDLILHSITWDYFEDYIKLFGDPVAVEKYARGTPWTPKEVEEGMELWISRWEAQKDPFSAFAVHLKTLGEPFIGHVILGHGKRFGRADLAFLFKPEYQHLGLSKQALTALLYGYAPRLIKDGYCVNLNDDACEPTPLKVVHATARLDDPHSLNLLCNLGMRHGVVELLWGALRLHFMIKAEDILRNQTLRNEHFFGSAE